MFELLLKGGGLSIDSRIKILSDLLRLACKKFMLRQIFELRPWTATNF